jgi:hypothetical protein
MSSDPVSPEIIARTKRALEEDIETGDATTNRWNSLQQNRTKNARLSI